MTLCIIDYGSGNIRSVAKAFEHVAAGKPVRVTSNAADLASATHIVLPGVGAYGDCMRGLAAIPGMIDALGEQVCGRKKPFLGICVGMQLLFERGLEHGEHAGLGWLPGEVTKIDAPGHKIPHMGWNELDIKCDHPLLSGVKSGDHAYFVHSYHAVASSGDVLATVDYGSALVATVARENIMGTQFHPEKSQKTGLKILQNFLNLR